MIKKGFLIYILLLGFIFIPKNVFALSLTGNATVGRSAVMDTSNNYYYTDWTSLSSNSLNSVPIPYSGGNYYHMGSEYVISVTLNGETTFTGHIRVPVVSNTIYNYQLMNGLNQNDFKFGFHQNFGVYNITPSNWSYNWECQTYPHLGVAHNYCYYDADFTFTLSEPLTGGYNFNFAVLNTTGIHSSYYYSGYDSNGNAIEFPVSAQNSGYSNLAPSVRLNGSSGSGSSDTDTEEIIGSITDSTQQLQDTITESYENLVKSQEVCANAITSSTISGKYIYFNGATAYNNGYGFSSGTYHFSVNSLSNNVQYYYKFLSSSTLNRITSTSFDIEATEAFNFWIWTSDSGFSSIPNFTLCKDSNGNQAIYDGIMDHDISGIDFTFGDIDVISDTPVSDLLLLPLELITKITTSLGSGCMTWDLPFNLWGNNNYVLHLPCLDLEDYLGSNVWEIIDDLCSILMLFNIFKMLLRFYESWTSLNDTFDNVIGGVK